ncbi:MAG: hypothetical protein GWN86_27655 [Desulfobacterales bacterium]|nr:hypothetical protein [Desulfobacterales bacterium]
MAFQYDNCPKCGSQIIKGAMRCTSCGALLTTAKDQEERIKRLRESQKKSFPSGAIAKLVAVLVIAGVLWYFFSEQIAAFVRSALNRLGF